MESLKRWFEYKKYTVFTVATIVVVCGALYYIQEGVFGGALQTDYMAPALFFLMLGMCNLVGIDLGKENKIEDPHEVNNIGIRIIKIIFITILAVIIYVFTIYTLFISPYMIICVSAIIFLTTVFGFVIYKRRKPNALKENFFSRMIITALMLVLIGDIIYLAALQPCIVPQGKNIMKDNGYTSIEYIDYIKPDKIDRIIDKELELSTKEKKLSSYVFLGRKDGKDYNVFVSAVNGRVIAAGELEKKDSLVNILKAYKK